MEKIKTDIDVGQQIFDNVPSAVRPDWAGLILRRFDRHIDKLPIEVIGLYEIIEDSKNGKRLTNNLLRLEN